MARDFKARKIRKLRRAVAESSAASAPIYRRLKDGKLFRLKEKLRSGELVFHDYDGKFDPSYFERV